MPVYQPGIPTGTVNLDVDYQNLQGNFEQANIVYGGDHYPFDNASPNQGRHNLVTTPPVVNNPPDGLPPATPTGVCKFYAYQKYSAIGLQQWSRGPSNAIPTPLTSLHGGPISINPFDTENIIDLAGMTRVMLILSGFNDAPLSADKKPLNSFVVFSQGTGNVTAISSTILAVITGTMLGIKNGTPSTAGAYYWTITFIRIE
jgi:hypothetical protein